MLSYDKQKIHYRLSPPFPHPLGINEISNHALYTQRESNIWKRDFSCKEKPSDKVMLNNYSYLINLFFSTKHRYLFINVFLPIAYFFYSVDNDNPTYSTKQSPCLGGWQHTRDVHSGWVSTAAAPLRIPKHVNRTATAPHLFGKTSIAPQPHRYMSWKNHPPPHRYRYDILNHIFDYLLPEIGSFLERSLPFCYA